MLRRSLARRLPLLQRGVLAPLHRTVPALRTPPRTLCAWAGQGSDAEAVEKDVLVPGGLTEAVHLLLEQEEQGVAADRTHDLFFSTAMQNANLYDAVLAYFINGVNEAPNSETYTSLIYVCVKLRRLDEAFKHFEEMTAKQILPDARTYAHLIKGCGRTRQVRRGEAFFRLLKSRNAPYVYDRRVYNAMINMYAHAKGPSHILLPAVAAPAWHVFEEMMHRGVQPDEVTYNSLIYLCSRVKPVDIKRAVAALGEMEAVGIPVTGVTLSTISQVLGKAGKIDAASNLILEHIGRGVPPCSSMWRPLMHASAIQGNVTATEELLAQMVEHCGTAVFDSFKHRVSHANNYLLLAHGHSSGFDEARAQLQGMRDRGEADILSFTIMIELATALSSRHGKQPPTRVPQLARERALELWNTMVADGIQPSTQLCHRMFAVWVHQGMGEMAEKTFEEMKQISTSVSARGATLASRWLGGDLDAVKQMLAEQPLSMSMCHTSQTYVTLIDAYVSAGENDAATTHLDSLKAEAKDKQVSLGHESTTPLLNTFSRRRGGHPFGVSTAFELHTQSHADGRPCAPSPSLVLCLSLLRESRHEDAAQVLMRMSLPNTWQRWANIAVAERLAGIAAGASAMEEGSEERGRLDELVEQARERFGLTEDDLATAAKREANRERKRETKLASKGPRTYVVPDEVVQAAVDGRAAAEGAEAEGQASGEAEGVKEEASETVVAQ